MLVISDLRIYTSYNNFTIVNLTYSKLAKYLHLKNGAKVIKKTYTNKLNFKIMKKPTINHKVEITNNVLGYVYVVLQYTTFTEDIKNEHVKVHCFNADTGELQFTYLDSFSLYADAKRKLKNVVLECMPI